MIAILLLSMLLIFPIVVSMILRSLQKKIRANGKGEMNYYKRF